jgi:hypothetical protein
MIIESEREHPVIDLEPWHIRGPLPLVGGPVPLALAAFLAMRQKIQDTHTHHQLHDDLVDHLERRGLVSPILTMISIMQKYDLYIIYVTP